MAEKNYSFYKLYFIFNIFNKNYFIYQYKINFYLNFLNCSDFYFNFFEKCIIKNKIKFKCFNFVSFKKKFNFKKINKILIWYFIVNV